MVGNNNTDEENVKNFKSNLIEYLGELHEKVSDPPWDIGVFENYGRGLVATRDIEVNEIIFYERPMIVGPRVSVYPYTFCVHCFKIEKQKFTCPKKCQLPVCENCVDSDGHRKECELINRWKPIKTTAKYARNLLNSLTSIRGLFLTELERKIVDQMEGHSPAKDNKTEIERMMADEMFENLNADSDEVKVLHKMVSVLNTNAFEAIRLAYDEENNECFMSLRGLYILGAIMNHSCLPNIRYVYQDGMIMKCMAAKPIKKGEQIFNNYSKVLWGTQHRIIHLFCTKSFLCNCDRCKDATEFGTYLAALRCFRTTCLEGRMLPINPLKATSNWGCDTCSFKMDNKKVTRIQDVAGSVILNSVVRKSSAAIIKYIQEHTPNILLPYNQFAVELKLTAIKCIDGSNPLEENLEKEKYCKEILEILDKLRYGECFIKGVLSYELFKAREAICKHKGELNELKSDENKGLLISAFTILGYSISTPKDLDALRQLYCN